MASVAAAVYVSVASVKIPVVFAPMERAIPVFPALERRLIVVVFVIEFDVILHITNLTRTRTNGTKGHSVN